MAGYEQSKFDSKSFNPVAFGKYMERIPATKRNELVKSKVLVGNAQIREAFNSQTGTAYATIPMTGRIGGKPQNYDGKTDMETNGTTTFERGVVVIGRMNSWTEKDFSTDITGGKNFMDNVAEQIVEYWDDVDQTTILAILSGIFAMTGAENLKFVNNHTYDISSEPGEDKDGNLLSSVGATTMNKAIQKACGDNKAKFAIAFMHSEVATTLENLRLLKYLKYTDADGIERDLTIGSWNGKAVLIDDSMPAVSVQAKYVAAKKSTVGALKCTTAGTGEGEVALAEVQKTLKTAKENDYVVYMEAGTTYTSYVMGAGSIDFENIGAKVPQEMARDPKTNGGQDTLFSRQRKVFAPYGISYTKASQASLSPTDEELKDGKNWELVHNGEPEQKEYIDHKAIPIARIISRG